MTHRMNPGIKARWVAALRSGEYAQTKGLLHRLSPEADRPAGHCCLGVLCELAVEDGVIERAQEDDWGYETLGLSGRTFAENSLLPREVREWARLETSYGLEWEDPEQGELALPTLNDNGTSFAQLADIIEEKL